MSFSAISPTPSPTTLSSLLQKQLRIENRFFRRDNQRLEEVVGQIAGHLGQGYRTPKSSPPLDLTKRSVRAAVIGHVCATEEALEGTWINDYDYLRGGQFQGVYCDSKGNYWTAIQTIHLRAREVNDPTFVVEIRFAHKQETHQNHKGNCRVDFGNGNPRFIQDSLMGSYWALNYRMSVLTGEKKENEQAVASLLLRHAQTFFAITHPELSKALPSAKISPDDVDWINRLHYLLFVVENARRRNPVDRERDLPYAFSLIRALRLVEAGHLTLKEVLSPNALYGAFTLPDQGKDLGPVVQRMERVNQLYVECMRPDEKSRKLLQELRSLSDAESTDEEGYDTPEGEAS